MASDSLVFGLTGSGWAVAWAMISPAETPAEVSAAICRSTDAISTRMSWRWPCAARPWGEPSLYCSISASVASSRSWRLSSSCRRAVSSAVMFRRTCSVRKSR